MRHGDGYLHHNYVVALLNDLFGIQTRGGCSCAGPYGHRLLGIDLATSHEFECEILAGYEGVKPGWVRINFNYFLAEPVVEFLLRAVEWVAAHGWKLLPRYRFDSRTGLWAHESEARPPFALADLSYDSGRLDYTASEATAPGPELNRYLEEADAIVAAAMAAERVERPPVENLPADFEHLRWFSLPSEVWSELYGGDSGPPVASIFRP